MESFDVMFTGHRPPKLGGWDENNKKAEVIKLWLFAVVEGIIDDGRGKLTFVSGGCQGTDQWGAEAVLSTKERIPQVQLHMAIPCDDYDGKWPDAPKQRLKNIIAKATSSTIVCPGPYAAYKNFVRDQWMVDRSSMVVAVFDGSKSGTGNTIRMAIKKGIPILRFNPETLKEEHV